MADTTVEEFAAVLKVPVERLMAQLRDAGIEVGNADFVMTDEMKLQLLEHLREVQAKSGDVKRRIVLRRS